MAGARLALPLTALSQRLAQCVFSSTGPHITVALLAGPAGASAQCLALPSRACHIYRDPNYKYFRPTFGFQRKHKDPKFKKDRQGKFIKIDLPDPNEKFDVDSMSPEEIRAKMKEKGIKPVRPWQERPIYISSTNSTFEPYVPPEGDGRVSTLTTAGAKQRVQFLEKKGKSMMAVRKIRQFDDEFDPKVFAEEAQEIYVDAHKTLAAEDKDKLHQYVTERAFPLVTHEIERKTMRWQFLGSLEPPRVVHARCTNIITKENIFAQITVRFHTKQTLAVYDRFGRLMHGSEVVARDVLEYVVFEKHVANTYGLWRIHDKIIPDWMPPRQPTLRTYRVQEEEEDLEPPPTDDSLQDATEEPEKDKDKPAVALA